MALYLYVLSMIADTGSASTQRNVEDRGFFMVFSGFGSLVSILVRIDASRSNLSLSPSFHHLFER